MEMPRWRKPYLEFEWAPPLPSPLPPTKPVGEGVSVPDPKAVVEGVKTPELLRADSERPSIADSEATLVSDTPANTEGAEQLKGPPEKPRNARSFGLVQSFRSFVSDPGNPSISF
jgi:hypothetical protein